MAQANELDLLGGGSASGTMNGLEGRPQTDLTPEQIADTLARKKAWMASQGLDMNGNQLPAYGTPASQGGTATGYQTATQQVGASGRVGDVWHTQLGSSDVAAPGAAIVHTQNTGGANPASVNTNAGVIVPGQELVGSMAHNPGMQSAAGLSVASNGAVTAGGGSPGGGAVIAGPGSEAGTGPGAGAGSGRGALLNAQSQQGVNDLRGQIQASGAAAANGIELAADSAANMNPLTNRGLTSTAAEQAKNALGPAPTIDQNLADRNSGQVSEAVQQAGQVVDRALAPVGQKNVNSAMSAARNVLDQALNGPDTTARIGAQTLRNQLALARSASGGAGGAQEALRNAQFAAPELMSQAADAGIREQQAKLGIASQQTGQLAQTALGQQQNTTQRLGVAAQAAGTSAQAAQGQRAQDIEMAKANLDAGVNLQNKISELTGQQLNLNQQNQELLGNMARDLAKTQFDYSQLDAQTQDAEFERWIKAYGIDVAAAAQIRAAAANNEKGVMDYLGPIIGAGATLGAAALKGG